MKQKGLATTTFLQLLLETRRHQTGQNEGQIRVRDADLPFSYKEPQAMLVGESSTSVEQKKCPF